MNHGASLMVISLFHTPIVVGGSVCETLVCDKREPTRGMKKKHEKTSAKDIKQILVGKIRLSRNVPSKNVLKTAKKASPKH